jgi:phage FluMu gp28-like protein
MTAGAAITMEEWAELRREACQSLPGWMAEAGIDPTDLPAVLLPYQQKLLATTANSQVTGVEKSRRTGYTWAVGADAVLTSASARSAGGMDSLYIGYNLDMAREFIDVCGMWAKAFTPVATEVNEFVFKDKLGDDTRDIQAFRIAFASGYEIVALSSRPRSLRGRQGYVIIDEAAFHDDLAELIKAAMALLIWGGKVLVISTHDGDTNPFNQFIEEIKKGRQPGALIHLDFDEALQDGLYQRICLVTGKTWSPEAEAAWRANIIAFYGSGADEELFAIPSTGSGTYIPSLLIERQQKPGIPVVRWHCDSAFLQLSDHLRDAEAREFCERDLAPLLECLDPKLMSFLGEDFAMTGDLTVLWPLQMQRNMVRRPPFTVELRNVPYGQQRLILWYILDRLPRFVAAAMDATGNGAPLAQETATRYGLNRISQVKINEAWYRDVTPKFKAAFEDGLTELPRDLDVYNDHRGLKLVRGVAQVQRQASASGKGEDAARGKAGLQRHGDSVIAHMMAWMASTLDVAEYSYTPAIPRPGRDVMLHDDDFDDDGGNWRARRGDFEPGAY